jgi:hypothetical protein
MKKKSSIQEQKYSKESYYTISPNDYKELLKMSGYQTKGISKLRKFQGKPLWVTGNLDLSNSPISDLGNLGYIEGNLDIRNTKISDLGDTVVKGFVTDYGTPIHRKRLIMAAQIKRNKMLEYKENDEWDLDNVYIDELGLKANALYKHLIDDETIDESETEIYELYPTEYDYYGLKKFELIDDGDSEWVVGTEEEMDDALFKYCESLIDELGLKNFNRNFLEDHVDADAVREYFEELYREIIYDSPSNYFDDDDFELTPKQKRRIQQIEEEIDKYVEQQSELDPNQEDYDEIFDDLQNLIDDLESEKEDIVPDTSEPTDEMVESKLEEILSDIKNNPIHYLEEFGLDMTEFIDKDSVAKALMDDGYGQMNSYDGDYDVVTVLNNDYYIMRIS